MTTYLQDCLSVFIDRPAEEIPDFSEAGEDWYPLMEWWLNRAGWLIHRYKAEAGDTVTGMCIAKGISPRGTYHVVIESDGEVIYDPHESGLGLVCTEYRYAILRAT